MKRLLLGLLSIIVFDATAADWRLYEVTNSTAVSYDVYAGTTDYEGGMNFINATKVGQVRPGKVFKLPQQYFTISPTESNFKYLVLRPLAPVKEKTNDIRVFFPLHQQGASLPDNKNKKSYTIKALTSHIAAGNDYGKHYSMRQGTAQFYGRPLMNAYLGVYINSDGMPRFYSASDKHPTLPKTVVIPDRGVNRFD